MANLVSDKAIQTEPPNAIEQLRELWGQAGQLIGGIDASCTSTAVRATHPESQTIKTDPKRPFVVDIPHACTPGCEHSGSHNSQ